LSFAEVSGCLADGRIWVGGFSKGVSGEKEMEEEEEEFGHNRGSCGSNIEVVGKHVGHFDTFNDC
jgi:hypothetical protein